MSAIESNVMVNPINDSNTFKVLDSENRLQRTQSIAKDPHTDEDSHVNLSNISKQLANLKELILSAPEVNSERVAFFKEQLANGHYQISCSQIATNMFRDIELV
ncbi:flagellar biosynthesis anti-sigma factor FlgM [Legionella cardiaca]|uniref:Negative regulator of flagellin synthesis n=1 Tax=Legionella cardiaca TaxID=1071983 RepID=A0ABY8AWH9_9GAMM|nr:flagellar biosynthesis anti-sigma factor FlgM [Legionella cardiaca]WED44531.1 flagellar biosynthesis anti-sigma factor FlgM [Legionella cardiaca]